MTRHNVVGRKVSREFAVVQHSSGAAGGFVVREIHDGWIAAPYSDAPRLAVRKSERAAQAVADKMNARGR